MNRHPDTIVILRQIGEATPYDTPHFEQVYTGRCKCSLDRQSAFRMEKVMDSTYQVVIPDRSMPEIGENYIVGIKMHTNKNSRSWDLIGYVKDFARYDRVCNLYFQIPKENIILEDIPAPAVNTDKRTNIVYNDGYMHMESVGLLGEDLLVENEVLTISTSASYDVKFYVIDSKREWKLFMTDSMTEDVFGIDQLLLAAYFRNDREYKHVFVLACKYAVLQLEQEEGEEYEEDTDILPVILIEVYKDGEICHKKEIKILEKG